MADDYRAQTDLGITHVISMTSGGLSSFGANVRAVAKYGADRVVALFTDVLQEDQDVYRFLVESTRALGIRLEVIADGRTPWEVAFEQGMIPNSMVPLCSRVLKMEPAKQWLAEHAPTANLIYGIAWWEIDRCEGITRAQEGHTVEFPMVDAPYVDNAALSVLARSYGIEPPRSYAAGYAHANCAGACFRAGHAAWRLVLRDSPDLFFWHELMEQHFRRSWGRHAAVLRWRSGPNDGQPMTLQTLRRLVEQNREAELDLGDFGGCGCVPGDSSQMLLQIKPRAAA